MDRYTSGIGMYHRFSDQSLRIVDGQIRGLQRQAELSSAFELQELVYTLELLERLTLCRSIAVHLGVREGTRWYGLTEHTGYPESSAKWSCYVNSRLESGGLNILFHPLVKEGEMHEH